MFNKKGNRELPPALQQLGQHYSDSLAQVSRDHAGTYHEPLLKELYINLGGHVDDTARYSRSTFPPLQSRLQDGKSITTIQFARSPKLTSVFREVLPYLSHISETIMHGNGGCFSIDPRRSGRRDRFPSYDHLIGRNDGPSGNRSPEDWYDLFTQQQDHLFPTDPVTGAQTSDFSSFGTCGDGICKACPTCKAGGEELLRSIKGITAQQDMSSIETLDAPEAASVHLRSLITTATVLGRHLLHLGSTEDTKDDPRYMGHGLEHGNASSLLQGIAHLLKHASDTDFIKQGGAAPIKNHLVIQGRPRLITAADPIDPVPFGSYNLGKEQRRKKNK